MGSERFTRRVESRYRDDSGNRYRRKHDVPDNAHRWIARHRADKLKAFIDPRSVVLEFGVGPGWNLESIHCRRRLGYDLDASLEGPLAEKGIRFVADLQTVPDGSIDVVICHHVLEHVLNPVKALGDIRRLLRNEGRLILIVPYETRRRGRSFEPDERDHHLYSWTVQTLGNLVADLGFTVRQAGVGRYGWDRFLAVWADRLNIGDRGFGYLKKLTLALYPLWEVRIVAEKADINEA
jgi:SAM-dependent methyltransferase